MEDSEGKGEDHGQRLAGHPGVAVLFPHVQSYLQKGMVAYQSGEKRINASTAEIYAEGVWERVSELDNALSALDLTWDFISNLGSSGTPVPETYRYHYENFVLRVIGVVDRAHRLVGASLLMDRRKYEGVGGNRHVEGRVRSDHPQIHAALVAVADAVGKYRGPRNELIHSSTFSTQELWLFTSIEQFDIDVEGVDIEALRNRYFLKGSAEIALTIERLVDTLTALLDALAPLFKAAAEYGGEDGQE
ncbi:hypothetical protein ACNFZE_16400 [Pseudomonas aeruginosa]|uniref:hypothetical protein n=1 Tax=Pseudomonas aeruginosa TaxID=287 RepID=UPI00053DEE0F|nr:hypothetical protein [Pseudomonas aeruginosa]HDR2971122.1 hypothetical protein [Pseudomonas aeruginosa]